MSAIRSDPDRIIEGVVNGLNQLGGFPQGNAHAPRPDSGSRTARVSAQTPFGCSTNEKKGDNSLNYVMLRRLFDDVYYAVEELAGKYPNEVMASYKVKQINEVLEEIRKNVEDGGILPYLRLIDEPEETIDKEGKTIWKGLSYSDILLMLKWYKVLPR